MKYLAIALVLASCNTTGGGFQMPVISVESDSAVVARSDAQAYFVAGDGTTELWVISSGVPILVGAVEGGRAWIKSDSHEETVDFVDDPSLGKTVVIPGWIYGRLFPNTEQFPDGRTGVRFPGFTVVLSPGQP